MSYEGPAHELPPLYARWMQEMLVEPIPKEQKATCGDCAMCVKEDGEVPTSAYFFDPSIKCCVYMPELANFLVGGILGDPEPSLDFGRAGVRTRVEARVAVTPFGVGRPATYDLVFRNSAHTIGRARALKCPHFVDEGGVCGIWKYRDAMCTTWFCRHDRGQVGAAFWRALRELLTLVEGTLARWSALRLGIAPEVLQRWVAREGFGSPQRVPDATEIDGVVERDIYDVLWGEWAGREEEFYRACAERVTALSWADVMAIGGPELEILSRVARKAHETLLADHLFPVNLKLGLFQLVGSRAGGARAITYSALDALDLPSALLSVLSTFDGRPTGEILRSLAAQGIGIDRAYLRQLCDWGILVEGS